MRYSGDYGTIAHPSGFRATAGRWLVLTVLAAGCGDGASEPAKHERGAAETSGESVPSVVGGHSITVDDVATLVASTGLTPEQALRRLQARFLLVDEAERRGLSELDAKGRSLMGQAMVQALLAVDVETVKVSDSVLRRAYEAQSDRFRSPEKRAALHVLAKLKDSASDDDRKKARAFAARMIEVLAQPPLSVARVKPLAEAAGAFGPFEVVVEDLPPTPRNGQLVEPFLKALFSTAGTGVVASPVVTTFGVHAVAVTEVIPGKITEFEEAEAQLKAEALLQLRERAVAELLSDLRGRVPVVVHENAITTLVEIEP